MTLDDLRTAWLSGLLSLIGIVVVTWVLVWQFTTAYIPIWVFVAGVIAVACWALLGDRAIWRPAWRNGLVIALIMIVVGGIGASPSNGLLIVPVAVGVLRLVGEPRTPLWIGGSAALAAVCLIALGSLTISVSVLGLLSLEGGVVLGLLGGMNRRQARIADLRERELLERTLLAREERARISALETRQSLARDIHDVLAHSLGGLVIQLDATDALLESGHVGEAAARVRDARALAVAGLGETRRAVDALREPDAVDAARAVGAAPVRADGVGAAGMGAGAGISAEIADLVVAHERLGGLVRFSEVGEARAVPNATAHAFRRAAQESLSNARKHAPGVLVTMELVWEPHRLALTVSNPLRNAAAPLAASGGGNGLRGMRERFDALPGGHLSAGVRDDDFVVSTEAQLE
ncbi:MAG: two-component sensor histidine kinase [Microbacteriaceae bacterium]|nr:MAG: two-component sensor histidine kinase [Microbacteriaceae bacterium]